MEQRGGRVDCKVAKKIYILLRVFISVETCLLSCSIATAVRVTSFCDNSALVACGHYLATAVSLAPQSLLLANTPQYK
jgi:hypothetical protein